MTSNTLPDLTAGFPEPTDEAWRALVEKALGGRDFDRALTSDTLSGVKVNALYAAAQGAGLVKRSGAGAPWTIAQRVDLPNASAANAAALGDLMGGASGLVLVSDQSAGARGFGLELRNSGALETALQDVAVAMIALALEPGPEARAEASLLRALVSSRGDVPDALSITWGFDPLGSLMRDGILAGAPETLFRELADDLAGLSGDGFRGPFIACDVRRVHEAGGSETGELAAALAIGVAYLRGLEAAGRTLTDTAPALHWTFAVDSDQLFGIAKLRAMRKLWARVCDASGLDAAPPIHIRAETAWRMLSKRDPAVNMLRATIATFAAGVGGADAITVLPHTLAHGVPRDAARRLARNTQLVLLEEANLWRVADPSAGAGAIEAMTDALCERAWAGFQAIEAAGGWIAALKAGQFQASVADVAAKRRQAVQTGREELTGVTAFPPDGDAAMDVDPVPAGTPLPHAGEPIAEPLPSLRLSAPFEALAEATAAQASETGRMTAVFLARIGPAADHAARATWTANRLAVAGIGTVGPADGFLTSGDVGQAFAQSGAAVACLCGDDDAYATLGDAAVQALKSAGAAYVIVAGRPADTAVVEALETSGSDLFLTARGDILGDLRAIQEAIC
ncbi:MAG: methylmalonyl-CoA mutase family protein [Pseudomonadota bacterium]